MSHPDPHFVTEVDAIEGYWPAPPRRFSYSSFREAEECPRRWTLSRATYPTVWDRAGYPERPNLAAVIGDVVHAALEEIVRALTSAGLDSGASAGAVNVLRSIGGYSGVVERAIAASASKLESNPRMTSRLASFVRDLRSHLPEMRQRTQAALSRTRLVPRSSDSQLDGGGSGFLGDGSYPEFDIVSDSLGWAGRVDLLTIDQHEVHILDYKTGAPSEHHAEQLLTYALLWFRRSGARSEPSLATKLTLSYPSHDIDVPAPGEEELLALERDLVARSAAVRQQLALERPAHPSPENCTFCSVRHLCDMYWSTIPTAAEGPTDAEFTVTARNGPRSFHARLHTSEVALVRTSEEASMPTGSRWRLLSGFGVRGDEGDLGISVTASSELYQLRSRWSRYEGG